MIFYADLYRQSKEPFWIDYFKAVDSGKEIYSAYIYINLPKNYKLPCRGSYEAHIACFIAKLESIPKKGSYKFLSKEESYNFKL